MLMSVLVLFLCFEAIGFGEGVDHFGDGFIGRRIAYLFPVGYRHRHSSKAFAIIIELKNNG